MKANESNFLDLLRGSKQYIIPIYQRRYEWENSHCQRLLEDLERIGKGNTPNHFVGSFVNIKQEDGSQDIDQFLVIDGQQRLTTTILILARIIEILSDHGDLGIGFDSSQIRETFLINPHTTEYLKRKLQLSKIDKDSLNRIISGHTLADAQSLNLKSNYSFISELVNKDNTQHIFKGLEKLTTVDIKLELGLDNPQLIYETINSGGKPLAPSDLIRNYLLLGFSNKEQIDLYENYWYPIEEDFGDGFSKKFDEFVRNYLTLVSNTIPAKDKIYESFKKYAEGSNTGGAREILQDLRKYSRYYIAFAHKGEQYPPLKVAFNSLLIFQATVTYPFLLKAYDRYDSGFISGDEFTSIIKLCESYLIRRFICSIPTNRLNVAFKELSQLTATEQFKESVHFTFSNFTDRKVFPRNIQFLESFKRHKLYSPYNIRYCKHVLEKIELHNRTEDANLSECTVEHIMPQSLTAEWKLDLGGDESAEHIHMVWLDTIGNLTLTGNNSRLGNASFQKKKEMENGFDNSPLNLNAYLQKIDKWEEQQIKARAEEHLFPTACEIWKEP